MSDASAPTESDRLHDTPLPRPVPQRTRHFEGKVVALRTDSVDLGDGQIVVRDVVEHPGAVGVIALDDRDRVLLVRQYRHPVGSLLWEPPAGLLDVPEEAALAAAQRELHEEAGFRARRWDLLVDLYNSPGGSDEAIRIYLARDLAPVPVAERPVGEGEERDMPVAWLDLDDAVDAVMTGRLHNPTAVAGVLAAWYAREQGWDGLRAADAGWHRHDSRASGPPG